MEHAARTGAWVIVAGSARVLQRVYQGVTACWRCGRAVFTDFTVPVGVFAICRSVECRSYKRQQQHGTRGEACCHLDLCFTVCVSRVDVVFTAQVKELGSRFEGLGQDCSRSLSFT